MKQNTLETAVPLRRRLLVGASGVVGGILLIHDVSPWQRWKVLIPVVALLAAAFFVHIPRFGAQLLARSAWWSNLVLGTLLCFMGSSHERPVGFALALACGIALLVIGGKGLAEARERLGYTPGAFQSSLLLLMVFALADAQTFLLFGTLELSERSYYDVPARASGVFLLMTGLVYVVGFVGLYRLQIWGAFLNVATSVLALVMLGAGIVRVDHDLQAPLCLMCALQVLAAAPMIGSLLTRRALPEPGQRARGLAAAGAIVLVLFGDAVRVLVG